jgi:hypothetical protein
VNARLKKQWQDQESENNRNPNSLKNGVLLGEWDARKRERRSSEKNQTHKEEKS